MARTLTELQKQYGGNRFSPQSAPGMGGGPGGRNRGMSGKPQNSKNTIIRLLSYLKVFRVHLVVVVFCMIVNTLTSLLGSYLLRPIINHIASTETKDDFAERLISSFVNPLSPLIRSIIPNDRISEIILFLVTGIIILMFVYLIGIITSYIQNRLMVRISQGINENIRNDLFSKMKDLPVRFFDNNSTGELMSRYTNDVDNIGVMLDQSLLSMVSGVITLVGTFVMMIYTNVLLTLVTVVFIPIFMFGGTKIAKMSRKYYVSQQAALGAINGYIEETVSGQKVIKVFNHENECISEFSELNEDMRDKQFKAQFYGGLMGPIMGNTGQISYAITAGLGGVLCALTFLKVIPLTSLLALDVGGLTIFVNYSRQFSMPINSISQQMTTIFAALAGAERVFKIMDAVPEDKNEESQTKIDKEIKEISFKDVYFGYNPDKTVLKHISLTVSSGQKIAFVGSTGAGKTTITNLLNRFYDINQGEITINGINIKDYKKDDLRNSIAMVLQDTHLFTGTVMENIRYGRLDATDEEVIEAAKTASAHSFIMRLADGYNTVLEGDGANLSQGQRQLLNIARAAISKAPILVLDEATSSVDTRTERHIEHGMDRLMKTRTTFVIAHRLSTVRNADEIIVLENGEIVEEGNHQQLLEHKGRYYELYTGIKELD